MRATLFDVCKKSGVSTATVSRVMNGSPLVREQTRRKVLDAARELGYRPSHAARTLARQRTDALGVIFPQIENEFYTEVLRGLDDVAAENNFHLMTAFAHNRTDEQELVNRFLRETMVDALVLLNLQLSDRFVSEAARGGLPVVLIDRPVSGPNLFSVSLDNLAGAEAALTHLFEQGLHNIAILTGPEGTYDADQRVLGSLETARQAGHPLPPARILHGDFTEASGRAAMQAWFRNHQRPPRALFAHNDEMAIGARNIVREKGFQMPNDMALVGFDDSRLACHLDLSSIHSPMRDMGRAAAQTAIQQVVTGEASKNVLLGVNLVVRGSSRNQKGERS